MCGLREWIRLHAYHPTVNIYRTLCWEYRPPHQIQKQIFKMIKRPSQVLGLINSWDFNSSLLAGEVMASCPPMHWFLGPLEIFLWRQMPYSLTDWLLSCPLHGSEPFCHHSSHSRVKHLLQLHYQAVQCYTVLSPPACATRIPHTLSLSWDPSSLQGLTSYLALFITKVNDSCHIHLVCIYPVLNFCFIALWLNLSDSGDTAVILCFLNTFLYDSISCIIYMVSTRKKKRIRKSTDQELQHNVEFYQWGLEVPFQLGVGKRRR